MPQASALARSRTRAGVDDLIRAREPDRLITFLLSPARVPSIAGYARASSLNGDRHGAEVIGAGELTAPDEQRDGAVHHECEQREIDRPQQDSPSCA